MAFFALLVGVVALIYYLSKTRALAKVFDVLPVVFWVYFIPMVMATLGMFPASSPVYGLLSNYMLPSALFLLFLSSNIPDILKLGPRTIFVVIVGSFGIVVGAAVGVMAIVPFFKMGWLPESHGPVLWKGVAALSGSWMGGSANQAAVWESLTGGNPSEVERQIFSATVAVDVIVAYSWMAIVIALAAFQKRVDRANRAGTALLEEVNQRIANVQESLAKYLTTASFVQMAALALAATLLCSWLGTLINDWLMLKITNVMIRSVLGAYAIMILLVTAVGLGASLTPLAKLEGYGASKVGYALLYTVLARIGARANLNDIGDFPWYILMGVVWVAVHAVFLFTAMKLLRLPMFFAATASQANIGGPVSAPVVAAAYQPNLAVVGLLMAIIGNIVGTPFALFFVAPLVQFITRIFL